MNWREILKWQTVQMLRSVGLHREASALQDVEIPIVDGGGFWLIPGIEGRRLYQTFDQRVVGAAVSADPDVLAAAAKGEDFPVRLAIPIDLDVNRVPVQQWDYTLIPPWDKDVPF